MLKRLLSAIRMYPERKTNRHGLEEETMETEFGAWMELNEWWEIAQAQFENVVFASTGTGAFSSDFETTSALGPWVRHLSEEVALLSAEPLEDYGAYYVLRQAEAQAQVRHVSRLFIAAAHLRVPFFSVVLRKGYGLGAMAMCAGGFHAPQFTVAWPTGEFGAMGLEGAVRLGYRKELEAQSAGAAREALFEQLLAQEYAKGSALNMAATLEIDAVIDPVDTRDWLFRGLQAQPALTSVSHLAIDSW